MDVTDAGCILLLTGLFGAHFALLTHGRAGRTPSAAGALATRRSGVAGMLASVVGLSTGPCSVMGCGAPVLPVVGLAFAGLSSGTLAFLAGLSRVATAVMFVALVGAVVMLGWRAGAVWGAPPMPVRTPVRRTTP